jgi:hypothetical protein
VPATEPRTATVRARALIDRSRARVATYALVVVGALGVIATPAAGAPAEQTTRHVFRVADLFGGAAPEPVGSSTLVRTDRGLSATLETTGLTPGHVVTLWAVVFNDPAACEAGTPISRCGPGDAHAGRGGVSPNHAAGGIVADDGTIDLGGHLRKGDTSRALAGPGVVEPRGAEVILVVKSHGPKIPHLVSEQLHTFAGGCADQSDAPPGAPPELVGASGPNDCAELQVSVHGPGQ